MAFPTNCWHTALIPRRAIRAWAQPAAAWLHMALIRRLAILRWARAAASMALIRRLVTRRWAPIRNLPYRLRAGLHAVCVVARSFALNPSF